MRIRRKKWAEKELNETKFYIDKPEVFKGSWKTKFKFNGPLHIELGCGKGLFISTLAKKNKNINYIAVDMIEAMLGISKRNIEESFKHEDPDNLFLIRANVEKISDVFDEKDSVERIYINFCNPWPKKKHNKRRLTHIRQLNMYRTFLTSDGKIYFKTDDDELFNASLDYLNETNFKIISITKDLEKEPIFEENIITEHEKMFMDEGIKIKALIAEKNE